MSKTRQAARPVKDMFVDVGLPHWMLPAKQSSGEPYNMRTWQEILERLAAGETITSMLRENDHLPDIRDAGGLRTWINSDPERKAEYEMAQEIGTESMTDHMLQIAEGADSMEDVQRSQLRVNTYKWLIGCRNRRRYGDKMQVEQNVNVNIVEAMEQADRRVIDIKGEILESDNNE